MQITAVTIFPELFDPFCSTGIVRRAVERELIRYTVIDPRDFTDDRHRTVDDRPYGGGCGMVMKPEPLSRAIEAAREKTPGGVTILMSPRGRLFNQEKAEVLSEAKGLIFVCGRYEGVDERICRNCIDLEISIGDYVLTGGEIPAMTVMDAVIRLLPGALGGEDSASKDSFTTGLLEHAHYTRPPRFEDEEVPEILLSGHHGRIEAWRREGALIHTLLKRPDLLRKRHLDRTERKILEKWRSEIEKIIHGQYLSGADSSSGRQ